MEYKECYPKWDRRQFPEVSVCNKSKYILVWVTFFLWIISFAIIEEAITCSGDATKKIKMLETKLCFQGN